MHVVAVVVSGDLRDGPAPDRDIVTLAGVPVVARTVRGLVASGVPRRVVVVCSPARRAAVEEAVAELPASVVGPDDLSDVWCSSQYRSGQRDVSGRDRIETKRVLLVHDASRPLTPPALAVDVVSAVAAGHAAAVPVLPASDTVKRVSADGLVVSTVDRSVLRVVQTPQAFDGERASAVLRALAEGVAPERAYTAVSEPAFTVTGHHLAFAIRSRRDHELAEVLAGRTP